MTERYLAQALDAMGEAWIDMAAFEHQAQAEHLAAMEPVGGRVVDTQDNDKVVAEWRDGARIYASVFRAAFRSLDGARD